MKNPYSSLPPSAFWRSAVMERTPLAPTGIYKKKFAIGRKDKIATAGSCFAQHIGRQFKARGYNLLDLEPAPIGFPREREAEFGFGMFSARFGNIYTTRQLLQLAREAFGAWAPSDSVWRRNGRFYDAFRPAIEPEGLASEQEVAGLRRGHLAAVRELFMDMDVFIFTLGLTEAWLSKTDETVFPTAPGVVAGEYDPARYGFRNFGFVDVVEDFSAFLDLIAAHRTKPLKVLLTVSPVPLTATASGQHVLAATTYSKAVLRAAAGHLSEASADIDYFPSYEIVSSSWSRGIFYEANLRSVTTTGVGVVMKTFFAEHDVAATATKPAHGLGRKGFLVINREDGAAPPPASVRDAAAIPDDDVQCEEALLEAFAP
jgi:hypothetical protein